MTLATIVVIQTTLGNTGRRGVEMYSKTICKYYGQQHLMFGVVICLQLGTIVFAEKPHAIGPPITGLIFNEDDTEFFSNHIPSAVTGEDIDRMVNFYADAGVKVFMCAVVGERTTYDSDVWESYWDDYDPNGPDDQPRLRGILPEELDEYRQTFDTSRRHLRAGCPLELGYFEQSGPSSANTRPARDRPEH